MLVNLDACRAFTGTEEGDQTVSLDPADPGNWSSGTAGVGTLIGTRWGVSAPELIAWMGPGVTVTAAMMASLPQATADAIFGAEYFNKLAGPLLPAGLDLATVDMGYNAGTAAAGRLLQQALGFTGGDVDGWVGAQTVAAAQAGGALTLLGKLSADAAKPLQAFLGVRADGDVGPITIAAAQARNDRTCILLAHLADVHHAYYQNLANFRRYGSDWTRRSYDRLTAGLALMTPANGNAAAAATAA